MTAERVPSGTVHTLPSDLQTQLAADAQSFAAWKDITPLARNEWICWVEDAKRPETRMKRIRQAQENLADGKRRPCCWPGCSHRAKDGS
ncbi:MAG: YdeI/OmpD-associated family protein [Propionibacteriaceae bacterium]|nr:YdeI/OmpD-associated family protein [Propionibacteriaceae bacterium]